MKELQTIPFKRIAAVALCLWLAAMPSSDLSAQSPSLTPQERGLWRSLRNYVDGPDPRHEDTRIAVAFVDLNGDRQEEAIVLVSGRSWCGTGGCRLWILRSVSGGWSMVGQTATVNAPIRVLETRSNGWRDIALIERFNAYRRYEVIWSYSGGLYPYGAETAPRNRQSLPGRVVISADDGGRPLFP